MMTLRTALTATCVVVLASACSMTPTAPPLGLEEQSASPRHSQTTPGGFIRAHIPALSLANIDRCDVVTYPIRGGRGSHRAFRMRSPSPAQSVGADTTLGILHVFAMRKDNKTTVLNAGCVVPTKGRTAEALGRKLIHDL